MCSQNFSSLARISDSGFQSLGKSKLNYSHQGCGRPRLPLPLASPQSGHPLTKLLRWTLRSAGLLFLGAPLSNAAWHIFVISGFLMKPMTRTSISYKSAHAPL
jgi:hypothetical protein